MRPTRALALATLAAGSAGAFTGLYLGLVTGALTLDLGVGRRIRPLGPIEVAIEAPREVVYDVATAPYAARPTQAMREKVTVLERGPGLVLAAHRTPVGSLLGRPLTATTTETVGLEPPERMKFRLLRGPVPHVIETFQFIEIHANATLLRYEGELGTDLWALGQRWGDLVAKTWEDTVRGSLDQIKSEGERRAH
jgi:hypothetical protein